MIFFKSRVLIFFILILNTFYVFGDNEIIVDFDRKDLLKTKKYLMYLSIKRLDEFFEKEQKEDSLEDWYDQKSKDELKVLFYDLKKSLYINHTLKETSKGYTLNFTPHLFYSRIEEILVQIKDAIYQDEMPKIRDLKGLSFLPDNYSLLEENERMYLLSLGNIDLEFLSDVNLYNKESSVVFDKFNLKQNYFNICAGSVVGQFVKMHLPTPELRIKYLKKLSFKLRNKVDALSQEEKDIKAYESREIPLVAKLLPEAPSMATYSYGVLDELDERIKNLSKSWRDNLSDVKKEKWQKEWNDIMQNILSVLNVSNTMYLTKYMFNSLSWCQNAKLMAPICIVTSLWPSYPSIESRKKGFRFDSETWENLGILKKSLFNIDNSSPKTDLLDKLKTKTDIDDLWNTVALNDGAFLSIKYSANVGHGIFIYPTLIKGKKRFLIADPLDKYFEVYNFVEFRDFVKNHNGQLKKFF